MPRRSRSTVGRVLADLGREFARLRLDWYLFGAQAAILRGLRRSTLDVDVTVFAPSHDGSVLARELDRQFALRVADVAEFTRSTRVLPLVHRATRLDVDLVLAGPGLEPYFLERSQPIDVDGLAVSVPLAEDLALMKLISGRERDLADVVELVLFDRSAIDLPRLREFLGQIEADIGESGLTAALDIVERRVGGATPPPVRSPPRRRKPPPG